MPPISHAPHIPPLSSILGDDYTRCMYLVRFFFLYAPCILMLLLILVFIRYALKVLYSAPVGDRAFVHFATIGPSANIYR